MMEIYNESMQRLEKPDLEKGWLEKGSRTIFHEAVKGVEEIWHFEIAAQYPNGGKDVFRVVDVPGMEAKEAWEEEIPVLIYHPYSQAELESIEADRKRPTMSERMDRMEAIIHTLGGRFDELVRIMNAYQTGKGAE